MTISFELSGVVTKHPNGNAYRLVASDQEIAFKCLTVNDSGRQPSAEESVNYDFKLEWADIAEIRKPASMFDRLLIFIDRNGNKTECIFANDCEEEAAFRNLKKSFEKSFPVKFEYEETPKWKLLVLPIGFSMGMVILGLLAYFGLNYLEQEGGRMRTHVVIVFVYKTLGKYGVLILFLLLSLIGIPWSLKKLRKYDEISLSNTN